MKLLPYSKITFITTFTKEEVYNSIKQNTSPYPDHLKIFYGSYYKDNFTISRKIYGRNGFPLKIKGNITTEGNKTLIETTFVPTRFVITFMFIWITGALFRATILTWNSILSNDIQPSTLIPVGLAIIGPLIMNLAFNQEYDTCYYGLKRILDPEEIIEH